MDQTVWPELQLTLLQVTAQASEAAGEDAEQLYRGGLEAAAAVAAAGSRLSLGMLSCAVGAVSAVRRMGGALPPAAQWAAGVALDAVARELGRLVAARLRVVRNTC